VALAATAADSPGRPDGREGTAGPMLIMLLQVFVVLT
jgi:hypothetical protein